MKLRIRFGKPLHGWWTGPGFATHHCQLPAMPKRAPAGLIYRCECGSEWTWKPAP